MREITKELQNHYSETYRRYGDTSRGVDWGENEESAKVRQYKMLELVDLNSNSEVTLLDVGCGYGALAKIIKSKGLNIRYSGIDLVGEMVRGARLEYPEYDFMVGDILDLSNMKFDYVVCNGIFTQKLSASIIDMNNYFQEIVKTIFRLCDRGIAFNLMSTYVNFQNENLYYRNPSEVMAWCMSELTPRVKVDCSYDLWYEYSVYLYK